jgi:trehalose/maltose hydrolase-like predicted phosphorylase
MRFDRLGRAVAPLLLIDGYEAEGEEKIQPMDNPLGFEILIAGQRLTTETIFDYRQSLDMRDGILVSTYRARLPNRQDVEIIAKTAVHPDQRMAAQHWTFRSAAPVRVSLQPTGHQSLRQRTERSLELQPTRAQAVVAARSGIGEAVSRRPPFAPVEIDLAAGEAAIYERTVSLGVVPKAFQVTGGSVLRTADHGQEPAEPLGFPEVADASAASWRARWETDIVIDGPVEDQQAVRSFLFYLRSAIHPTGRMAVSPMALSSTVYNGHVFWDADIWVFPALALLDPERAMTIPMYRLARAGANWPTTVFPWESSVTGRETATGETAKQLHVNGGVLWMLNQADALGLWPPGSGNRSLDRLTEQIAATFLDQSSAGPAGELEIINVMGPDEYHVVDNDLYTNLLAMWSANGRRFPLESEPNQIRFRLPQDDVSFLTYEDDPVAGYQQASAVLSIYPLQYPPAEQQARAMMERFPARVTPHGPAMTDSIYALIWARLGKTDRAYDAWRRSWRDFTPHPLLLFSEKRGQPITYFTTGAAGCLQTVLYGFLGFRIDSEQEPEAVWSKELRGDSWLTITPNLPKHWKSVTLRNFSVQGQRFTFTLTHDGASVTPVLKSQGVP